MHATSYTDVYGDDVTILLPPPETHLVGFRATTVYNGVFLARTCDKKYWRMYWPPQSVHYYYCQYIRRCQRPQPYHTHTWFTHCTCRINRAINSGLPV